MNVGLSRVQVWYYLIRQATTTSSPHGDETCQVQLHDNGVEKRRSASDSSASDAVTSAPRVSFARLYWREQPHSSDKSIKEIALDVNDSKSLQREVKSSEVARSNRGYGVWKDNGPACF